MDTATNAELEVHRLVEGFNLPKAVLYSVSENEAGAVSLTKHLEYGDIYDMLDSSASSKIAQSSKCVAVVTCGWAAPVQRDDDDNYNDELAPSQHPERRRVRLVVVASREGIASVLRFSDTPDEVVTDDGSARGSLADAVGKLFDHAGARNN